MDSRPIPEWAGEIRACMVVQRNAATGFSAASLPPARRRALPGHRNSSDDGTLDLMSPASVRFEDSGRLVRLGLMQTPDAYERFANALA